MIGMLKFHVDDTGISRLLPAVETITPVIDYASPSLFITKRVFEDDSAPASQLPPPGVGQAPESSTPSNRSNILHDPPPSPTTAYCVD
jgi:hypothetical protein